ncbi:hypothetical protein THAOC_25318, partial [Thalassiosira oceanica]
MLRCSANGRPAALSVPSSAFTQLSGWPRNDEMNEMKTETRRKGPQLGLGRGLVSRAFRLGRDVKLERRRSSHVVFLLAASSTHGTPLRTVADRGGGEMLKSDQLAAALRAEPPARTTPALSRSRRATALDSKGRTWPGGGSPSADAGPASRGRSRRTRPPRRGE